jgi:hypothetical protein
VGFEQSPTKEKDMIELTPMTLIIALVVAVVIAVVFVINIRKELK